MHRWEAGGGRGERRPRESWLGERPYSKVFHESESNPRPRHIPIGAYPKYGSISSNFAIAITKRPPRPGAAVITLVRSNTSHIADRWLDSRYVSRAFHNNGSHSICRHFRDFRIAGSSSSSSPAPAPVPLKLLASRKNQRRASTSGPH